ncbi:MAG TPA: hypothetical protein VHV30_09190 [Polyangiaceae bacterium]|nr:hypothetical protein [Polyangiaceae bacterium]
MLAAVENWGVGPAVARTWLHAVFKRAQEVGMSVDAAEKAFRPSVVEKKNTARDPKDS